MLRVLGRRAALPVFLLDFLKGFVAVTLTEILKYDAYINDMWLINIKIIAVFAAVLGHIFPIFAGFRGGKGVATLVGAITGIYPPVVLLCFAVWVVILMMTHYVSLASIVAGCCFPIFTIVSPKVNQSVPFIVFSFVTAVLLLYTHRKNIVRLKNGTESKIYIWKPHRREDKNSARKTTRFFGGSFFNYFVENKALARTRYHPAEYKNCLVPGTGKTRRNRFDKAVTPGKGERLLPESKLCFPIKLPIT